MHEGTNHAWVKDPFNVKRLMDFKIYLLEREQGKGQRKRISKQSPTEHRA